MNRFLERSIEELEGVRWGAPDYPSHLVQEAHRLRSVPIGDLSVEDLRLLIGQEIGTTWLMPIALALLEVDPLVEGDFYPGDLLSSVLSVKSAYWNAHPDERSALARVRDRLESIGEATAELLARRDWPSLD